MIYFLDLLYKIHKWINTFGHNTFIDTCFCEQKHYNLYIYTYLCINYNVISFDGSFCLKMKITYVKSSETLKMSTTKHWKDLDGTVPWSDRWVLSLFVIYAMLKSNMFRKSFWYKLMYRIIVQLYQEFIIWSVKFYVMHICIFLVCSLAVLWWIVYCW